MINELSERLMEIKNGLMKDYTENVNKLVNEEIEGNDVMPCDFNELTTKYAREMFNVITEFRENYNKEIHASVDSVFMAM